MGLLIDRDLIVLQNNVNKSIHFQTKITIGGLVPSTDYHVVCTMVSTTGEWMKFEESLAGAVVSRTLCCKEIAVSILRPMSLVGHDAVDIVEVSLSSSPSKGSLTISLNIFPNILTFQPQSIVFQPRDSNTSFPVPGSSPVNMKVLSSPTRISAYVRFPGQANITVSISGFSASEYSVSYPFSQGIVVATQDSASKHSLLPKLSSVVYTQDLLSLDAVFSLPTNRGDLFSLFPCSKLLRFLGVSTAVCVWVSDSMLRIFPSSQSYDTVLLGQNVSLIPYVLHLKCINDPDISLSRLCANYSASGGNSVRVSEPTEHVSPVVAISYPKFVQYDQESYLDLTASSGSGSGHWMKVNVELMSGDCILEHHSISLFKSIDNVTLPVYIPPRSYRGGCSYVIIAELCNIIGRCGITTHQFTVINTITPQIAFVGPYLRVQRCSQNADIRVRLTSAAMLGDCEIQSLNESALTQFGSYLATVCNISYFWNVTLIRAFAKEDEVLTSKYAYPDFDPFSLSVFSSYLKLGHLYRIRLYISGGYMHNINSIAETKMYIVGGTLNVHFTAGSYLSLSRGRNVTLDTLVTWDGKPVTDTRSLSYSWNCFSLTPSASSSSSFSLKSGKTMYEKLYFYRTESSLDVAALKSVQINSTYIVSVQVTATDGSSATADISVVIASEHVPQVTISPLSRVRSLNPDMKLKLLADISCQSLCTHALNWTVHSFSAPNPLQLALTPATNVIRNLTSSTSINLVLPKYALFAGSSYLFSLYTDVPLGQTLLYSSSHVVINTPPIPGYFLVRPETGVAMEDTFKFLAYSWLDYPEDLPLTFDFGIIIFDYSYTADVDLVLQSRGAAPYASFLLPGYGSNIDIDSYTLSCFVRVYDINDASTMLEHKITIQHNSFKLLDSAKDLVYNDSAHLLNSSMYFGSFSASDMALRLIALASHEMNANNCISGFNCTSVGRRPCSWMQNACGECLDGWVGDSGPSNDPCVPLSYLANMTTILVQNTCRTYMDCTFDGYIRACENSMCVLSQKSCANDCSGNGVCTYMSKDILSTLSSCYVGDSTCISFCVCTDGYFGESCSRSTEEFLNRIAARYELLQLTAYHLSSAQYTERTIEYWANALSSVVLVPSELGDDSLTLLHGAMHKIMRAAIECSTPYDSPLSTLILDLIDKYATSIYFSLTITQLGNTTGLLREFNVLYVQDYVVGQILGLKYVRNNFRISNVGITLVDRFSNAQGKSLWNISLTMPATPLERAAGGKNTSSMVITTFSVEQNILRVFSCQLTLGVLQLSRTISPNFVPMTSALVVEIHSTAPTSNTSIYLQLENELSESYSVNGFISDGFSLSCDLLSFLSGAIADGGSSCRVTSFTNASFDCTYSDLSAYPTDQFPWSVSALNSPYVVSSQLIVAATSNSNSVGSIGKLAGGIAVFTLQSVKVWYVMTVLVSGGMFMVAALLVQRLSWRLSKVDTDLDGVDKLASRNFEPKHNQKITKNVLRKLVWPLPKVYTDGPWWYILGEELRYHFGVMGWGGRKVHASAVCLVAQVIDVLISFACVAVVYEIVFYCCMQTSGTTFGDVKSNTCSWGPNGCSIFGNIPTIGGKSYTMVAVFAALIIIPFRVSMSVAEQALLANSVIDPKEKDEKRQSNSNRERKPIGNTRGSLRAVKRPRRTLLVAPNSSKNLLKDAISDNLPAALELNDGCMVETRAGQLTTVQENEMETEKKCNSENNLNWFHLPSPSRLKSPLRSPVKIDVDATAKASARSDGGDSGILVQTPRSDITSIPTQSPLSDAIIRNELMEFQRLNALSREQRALLQFQMDLLPYSQAQIFRRKCSTDFISLFPLPAASFSVRMCAFSYLFLLFFFPLFYLTAFMQRASSDIQVAWVWSVFLWLILDGCAIRLVVVVYREWLIPLLIRDSVKEMRDQLQYLIRSAFSRGSNRQHSRHSSTEMRSELADCKMLSMELVSTLPSTSPARALVMKCAYVFYKKKHISEPLGGEANADSANKWWKYFKNRLVSLVVLIVSFPLWLETFIVGLAAWFLIGGLLVLLAIVLRNGSFLLYVTVVLGGVALLIRGLLEAFAIAFEWHQNTRNEVELRPLSAAAADKSIDRSGDSGCASELAQEQADVRKELSQSCQSDVAEEREQISVNLSLSREVEEKECSVVSLDSCAESQLLNVCSDALFSAKLLSSNPSTTVLRQEDVFYGTLGSTLSGVNLFCDDEKEERKSEASDLDIIQLHSDGDGDRIANISNLRTSIENRNSVKTDLSEKIDLDFQALMTLYPNESTLFNAMDASHLIFLEYDSSDSGDRFSVDDDRTIEEDFIEMIGSDKSSTECDVSDDDIEVLKL